MLDRIKTGAVELLDTLSDGWRKFLSSSGRALTRFTRRRSDDESDMTAEETESWGLLAGEVAETDTHLIVRLEAPGMSKEDFDIRVQNGALRVRGEKRFQREERGARYHLLESAYGAFERAIALPCEVDPEGAEATYDRGVLAVRLPRSRSRQVHTIRVG